MDEASVDAEIASLKLNDVQLAHRVRALEKMIDTRNTVWYKRLWFRLDGWPPWYRLADKPKHRWWHSG